MHRLHKLAPPSRFLFVIGVLEKGKNREQK